MIQSVNIVVGSYTFKQDRLLALVFDELKDQAQIVTGAARPGTDKFSFEFVSFKLRMKSIFRQQCQRRLQFQRSLWMLAGKPPSGTNECSRRQE